MKLVIATPLYPPEIGGPATDSAALVSCLEKKNIITTIVPFSGVRKFPKLIRHIVYALRLAKTARGAASIIAFDTVSVGLPAALVARLLSIPLVVRVPGDYAWEQGVQRFGVQDSIDEFQHRRYSFRLECLRSAQRFVVQSAALVLAPSMYFKGIIATWGVQSEHLQHIYLGLDFTDVVIQPTQLPKGNILFTAGRLVPWKGFGFLIKLLQDLPEWQLVIAGDGPLHSELREQADTLGLTGRVHFAGVLPHTEVLGWCAIADAFVLNTSFESFSFQILEAMALGAPTITTRVGSLPELLTDGVEGVLCTPNDSEAFRRAILSTKEDPELWQKRRESAKRKASQFSLNASGDAFADAIMDLCA